MTDHHFILPPLKLNKTLSSSYNKKLIIGTGSFFIPILSQQGILKEKKNTNNVENNRRRIEKDTKVRINRDKVQDKGLDKKVEGEVKTDHSMIK